MRYKYEGDIATAKDQKVYRPHGRGKLTCYEDEGDPDCMADVYWIYEGAFDRCHVTGQGRTIHGKQSDSPGYIYDGEHHDWRAHGQGTSFRSDGTKEYEGQWKSDEYHGQGTSYRQDGNIREDGARENGTMEYEGQWEESCWKGVGTLYRRDGTISRNGTWVNGGSQEREWQEGEEMYWYEGDWDVDGWMMHGWGILYRPDRTTVEREGWWQNGEPVDGPPAGYPDAL